MATSKTLTATAGSNMARWASNESNQPIGNVRLASPIAHSMAFDLVHFRIPANNPLPTMLIRNSAFARACRSQVLVNDFSGLARSTDMTAVSSRGDSSEFVQMPSSPVVPIGDGSLSWPLVKIF